MSQVLSLTVVGASDLNRGSGDGLPSPFCILQQLENSGKVKKTQKTGVVKKSSSPKWGETFSFHIKNSFQGIKVKCYHNESFGKDLLGVCTLFRTHLFVGEEKKARTVTLPLLRPPKKSGKSQGTPSEGEGGCGTLTLSITFYTLMISNTLTVTELLTLRSHDGEGVREEEPPSSYRYTPELRITDSSNMSEASTLEYACSMFNAKKKGKSEEGRLTKYATYVEFTPAKKKSKKKTMPLYSITSVSTGTTNGCPSMTISTHLTEWVLTNFEDLSGALETITKHLNEGGTQASRTMSPLTSWKSLNPKSTSSSRSRGTTLTSTLSVGGPRGNTLTSTLGGAANMTERGRNSSFSPQLSPRGHHTPAINVEKVRELAVSSLINKDGTMDDAKKFAMGNRPEDNDISGQVRVRFQYFGTKLIFTVVECKDLDAKDSNGLSDPYVKLKLGEQKGKTAIIKESLNPVYNETFEFNCEDIKSQMMDIQAWDWDRFTSDDFIGKCLIPVGDYAPGVLHDVWVDLTPKMRVLLSAMPTMVTAQRSDQNIAASLKPPTELVPLAPDLTDYEISLLESQHERLDKRRQYMMKRLEKLEAGLLTDESERSWGKATQDAQSKALQVVTNQFPNFTPHDKDAGGSNARTTLLEVGFLMGLVLFFGAVHVVLKNDW